MKLVLVVVCTVNKVIGIVQWWNKKKGLNMNIGKTNKVGVDFYRNRPFCLVWYFERGSTELYK